MADLWRRRKVLHVSCDFLLYLLKPDARPACEFASDPIPSNVRIVDARLDHFKCGNGSMVLILESPEFDVVPEGHPIPQLMPVYKRLDCVNAHEPTD